PSGSAGSAFGHALWKALIGEADGYVDGVKDGFIDLSEDEASTTMRTRQIGGHDPVYYGVTYKNLLMNEVTSPQYIAEMYGDRPDLSDEELRAEAAEMDAALDTSKMQAQMYR